MAPASSASSGKFKDITVVPNASDFIDIVLSRTQRKTPTQIHPHFKISRVRSFYMRKVKFCQQTIHDKLMAILTEFPKLDELHPFYADLVNVLYDRDHYKIALGQCNAVRQMVDSVGKDYARLLKYSDSAYKCKMLKRAGLGRMCTALRRLKSALEYLEEVRQHLSRLPQIDPTTRTLVLAGFPNVGKSSFVNAVSRANVAVQPYAFTTKSLFVGHFDYLYTRWQVIDTPGVLDHPLEDRNTIEMTSITALAHLNASILYFLDASETCGYSLEQQVQLFCSLLPLFRKKPLILVINKCDLLAAPNGDDDDAAGKDEAKKLVVEEVQRLLREIVPKAAADGNADQVDLANAKIVTSSCLSTEGIDEARSIACDMLLQQRLQTKADAHKLDPILNRMHVTSVVRNPSRPPCIPPNVAERKEAMRTSGHKLERQLMEENGGAGVYSFDKTKHLLLDDPSWRYDVAPEFMDGKNVADFIDSDIAAKIMKLEEEEGVLVEAGADEVLDEAAWDAAQSAMRAVGKAISYQRVLAKDRRTKHPLPTNTHRGGRTSSILTDKAEERGIDGSLFVKNKPSKTQHRQRRSLRASALTASPRPITGQKRQRSDSSTMQPSYKPMDIDTSSDPTQETPAAKRRRLTASLRSVASAFKPNRNQRGLPDAGLLKEAERRKRMKGDKKRNKESRKGEGDRFVGDKMPKHLFSGKRGIGKTDRR